MTDEEKFIAFYKGIGIEPMTEPCETKSHTLYKIGNDLYGDGVPKCYDDFTGYVGFYSTIEFDSDGTFVVQGFWE